MKKETLSQWQHQFPATNQRKHNIVFLSMQQSDYLHVFPSGPLPPQNLSLSHVTTNSAMITWSRHPRNVPDGFVVNVTRGLNTRSRFLPGGKLGSYNLRELTPGQHYYVALTSVKNTGQEQIHSIPQHLAFTTCKSVSHNPSSTFKCASRWKYSFTFCDKL